MNNFNEQQFEQRSFETPNQTVPQSVGTPVYQPQKKKKGTFLKKCGGAMLFGIIAAISFALVIMVFEKTGVIDLKSDNSSSNASASMENEDSGRIRISIGSDIEEKENADTDSDVDVTPGNTLSEGTKVTTVVTDVTEVVEAKMPSIVSVLNNYTYSTYRYKEDAQASGSGIIVGSNENELLIVTNYHVIENNNSLTVVFCDDKEANAVVKGSDADMDLAVIAVPLSDISDETMSEIKFATMGDSDNLKVGEPVIAIGNSLGYGQSVTTGVVSALNRTIGNSSDTEFIQTDAAINPGNSGGALLNISGELIGINSNKIGGSTVEGMGYAIPINDAKPIIEELMNRETRTEVDPDERGYLGISGATISDMEASFYGFPDGVYIADVTGGTAADKAGLEKGDFIYSVDGEKVTTMENLKNIISCYKKGEKIKLGVYFYEGNEYVKREIEVTLQ